MPEARIQRRNAGRPAQGRVLLDARTHTAHMRCSQRPGCHLDGFKSESRWEDPGARNRSVQSWLGASRNRCLRPHRMDWNEFHACCRDVPLKCPSKPILHQLREEVHRAEAAFEAAPKSVTDAVPNRVSKALQELDAAAVWDLCSVDEAALPASAWREHIEIALSEIRGS